MASNVGNIKVKLNLDSAAYEQGIKAATSSISTLGTALGALGVGFGAIQLVDIGKQALKASSNFEQANISFEVMLGSAEKAQKLVNEIQNMANVTPFETQDLLDSAKVLMNFGIQLQDVLPDLKMLGDISGGNKEKMNSMTLAFAQMSSAGRLMGQDLLQMVNAGFNPLQQISEKTGKSMAVLKDEMSEGKISVQMVKQAFIDATSEGGRFYGMMDKQSQSLEGMSSTMSDAYTLMTRSISDMALPALKEQVGEVTNVINATTDNIQKMKEWAAVNQDIVGGTKDAAIAIAALAVAIPITNSAVVGIIASIRNFGVVTAATSAYQIAFATMLKGETALALIQYRAALTATIVEVRALTIAMLQCPLTWVTVVLGAGAAAWWGYQQNVKSTVRAIEELNNAQDQNVDKTVDAIRTIKELGSAKNLDYNQTKKLDEAISYLTEKYPNYIGKLKQELKLKGEISRATAEQIANEMTLAKVKGLQEARIKLNKDMQRDMFFSNILGKSHAGGRYGITKGNQKRDDALNAERAKLEAERKAIIEDLSKLNTEDKTSSSSVGDSSGTGKKKKGKTASQLAAEEKRRQKEVLDYKIALLDVEKYETQKTDEEIYQLDLKQANLRIASAKKGTSEYAQALSAKLKLERDHEEKLKDLKSQQVVDTLEYNKQEINGENTTLELMYEANRISKVKMLELEISNINKKKELERQALAEQLKLVQGNVAEEVKIKRASNREQEDLDRELMRKSIDLQEAKRVSFKDFSTEVSTGWGNTVSDLIKGDVELSNVFSSITGTLVDAFANQCGKMVALWLQNHVQMGAITKLFGIEKAATDATIVSGNVAVGASNTAVAGTAAGLAGANTLLTASNTAVAVSSGTAAATTATSAGVMTGAAATMGAGITAIVGPVAALAGAFATLALSTTVVALTMPIIAISTTIVAFSSALAAFGLGMLNVVMGITAATSLLFAPISVLLAAEFAIIAVGAKLAAVAVAQLAIALAAASAAAIPVVGWALAPAAATMTGAAIAAANTMVQFREKGGPVKKGQAYVVGEKRPELFVPDRDGTILPNTNSMGGGASNNYNVSVVMPISATDSKSFESRLDEFTEKIHSNLSKAIKRRKLSPLAT